MARTPQTERIDEMRAYLEENCEGIDASIFSGDVLYSDVERAELKEYVERWGRAIAEYEASEVTAGDTPMQCEHPDDQIVEEHIGHDEWEWTCKACGAGSCFSAAEDYVPVQERTKRTPQPTDQATDQPHT